MHERFSKATRLAMALLFGLALFCWVTIFGASDTILLMADAMIQVPFANVSISVQAFLIMAPLLLILGCLYLHLFYGYWLDLERDRRQLNLSGDQSASPIACLPTLFSLDHYMARLLTALVLYWLVPFVLATITWKAAVRLEWSLPLAFVTGLVTCTLVFLQIRRCATSMRQRNVPRWALLVLIASGMLAVPFNMQWCHRSLNLFRADLQGKWLPGVPLRFAQARFANFQGTTLVQADLREADLRRADLQGADLRRADLRATKLGGANLQRARLQAAQLWKADLWGADLQRTDLQEADLQFAKLRGADLREADLRNADISGAGLWEADLRGVDLRHVQGLTTEQLASALTDKSTQLPGYLKVPTLTAPNSR